MKIHPVFHISQLKVYRRPEATERTYTKLESIISASGELEYEVEKIINHRKQRRGKRAKIEYLIVWKGYPAHKMTWEPKENVANAPEKISDYYRRIEGNASRKEGRV